MVSQKTVRLTTLALLLVGFLFTSSSAFAYLKEVTVQKDVEIVKISEPVEIVITEINNDNDDYYLVPEGRSIAVGDSEIIEFQYNVAVSRELLSTVNLEVLAENILIGGDETYAHLVGININQMGDHATFDLYNDIITIIVEVRLLEPIDEQEVIELGLPFYRVNVTDSKFAFEEIEGKVISFHLIFSLHQKKEPQSISSN